MQSLHAQWAQFLAQLCDGDKREQSEQLKQTANSVWVHQLTKYHKDEA